MIRILLGGSPCTKWSIAQKNGRETEPNSGLGWDLFSNYKVALEKYKPDYFLYENNKSASQAIKDEIGRQLGAPLQYINSALVSAQNRERFYVHNWECPLPEDRGILLKDILDSGVTDREKARCVTASVGRTTHREYFMKQQNTVAIEPLPIGWRGRKGEDGKYHKQYESTGEEKANCLTTAQTDSMVAEPALMQYPRGKNKGGSIYEKAPTITASSYETNVKVVERVFCIEKPCGQRLQDKSRTITKGYSTCSQRDLRMDIETDGFMGKQGVIEKIPYYAIPIEWDENGSPTKAISCADGKIYTVYEVKDGQITIKDKQYPIKLSDGYYIIRKLTVNECKRLQTVPDWYEFPVSDSQAYKQLGNGWTVEVIKHLLSHIPNILNEEIEVLSMYDGMSCGQIALREMGCNVVRYYATEIDKYAIQSTQHNFPNTIQLGDAFQVREEGWKI